MIRSKGKNKLYEEKGVFGCVCRHNCPKGFMDIKHGERIAYSVYSLQHQLTASSENTEVKVMYDIACTLAAHLKKNERHDLLEKTSFAIPIFHCYGHKSSFQIQYSPRRQVGYGLTDGEGVERLWSYLRGFSAMTKEMNTGRRIDILTDALLHYRSRQLQHCGSSLHAKLKRCPGLISNTLSQLQDLFSKLDVQYGPELIEIWSKEEENVICEKNSKRTVSLTWEQRYVQNLLQLYQLRAQIACTQEGDHSYFADIVKKSKKVLELVESIEKREKVSKRWRAGETKFNTAALSLEMMRKEAVIESAYSLATERLFLISLKNKYADGQAIAIKLSKQITQRTNTIKTTLAKYNTSLKTLEDWIEGLPTEITFDEAKEPGSQLYHDLNLHTTQDTVPFTVKQSAVDLHNFLQRCKEEEKLLRAEVERLINHYLDKKRELEWYINENSGVQPKVISGAITIFKKEIVNISNALCSLGFMLTDNLTEDCKSKLPTFKIEAEHSSCHFYQQDTFEVAFTDETNAADDESETESLHLELSDEDSDVETN